MILEAVVAAAIAQQLPQVVTEPDRPEVQCVKERVQKSVGLDVSARLLAAEIADRCSELIPLKNEDCGAAQSICERIIAETRAQQTKLLQRVTYQLLLVHRQSAKSN